MLEVARPIRLLASGTLVASVFLVVGAPTPASGTKLRGGGLIAFAIATTGVSQPDLYTIRANGTGLRRLTKTPSISEDAPSWSPDGRRIAFARYGLLGTPGFIYTMNVDGSGVRRLLSIPGGGWGFPSWSPDGRWIAVFEGSDGRGGSGPPGIFLVGSDGRNFHKIPGTTTAQVNGTSWSPDSTRLVFSAHQDVLQDSIFVIGIDGSGRRQLTAGGAAQSPAWSPDGKQIAFDFSSGDGGSDIWVMNADGSRARQLTHVSPQAFPGGSYVSNATSPTWSPDSKRIAFTMGFHVHEHLYVMNADGSDQHRVGRVRGLDSPAWQP
jgi:TolB protein